MTAANPRLHATCLLTVFLGVAAINLNEAIAGPVQEDAVRTGGRTAPLRADSAESDARAQVRASGAGGPSSLALISLPPHEHRPHDPPAPQGALDARTTSPRAIVTRGPYTSVQVNVNAAGQNIVGDAANEPTIAIDPNDRSKMAIAWRQFDSITSDFRQAGYAYSQDGGLTWTFPGVIDPGVFRSDPILDYDPDGDFYLCSLSTLSEHSFTCTVFKSTDGGATWDETVTIPCGDKPWMAIDRTDGIGRGNIYISSPSFTRSTDGGYTFDDQYMYPTPVDAGIPIGGSIAVDPGGAVYFGGNRGLWHAVAKASTIQDPTAPLALDFRNYVDLGAYFAMNYPYFYHGATPNPGGLMNQTWIAADNSDGPYHGNIYFLASVWPGSYDMDPPIPLDSDPHALHFMRSADGGLTWSTPIRLSDDKPGSSSWQWFGTMSVAPNGRIDVVWNDTRKYGALRYSEMVYTYSRDGGETWTPRVSVTPVFDTYLGWPVYQQNKLGDYYHMISLADGAGLAYAATYNGEQDVYYVWLAADCNENGVPDDQDIAGLTSLDCDANGIPDECQLDCNDNGFPDRCDIADGTSGDIDGSGVPDECECAISCDPPAREEPAVAKNRYLSITPGNSGQQTAIRLKFLYMPPPFEGLRGSWLFVGEPTAVCENAGEVEAPPEGCTPVEGLEDSSFLVAPLQSEPHYMDWGTVGTIHITHEWIIPGATFAAEAIDETCDIHFENQYSVPLLLATCRWGDIVQDCATTPCTPPDGVVNVTTDVTALLDKFRNLAGTPRKVRCDLEPALPDHLINITDVTYGLDAFKGLDYPFAAAPEPCP